MAGLSAMGTGLEVIKFLRCDGETKKETTKVEETTAKYENLVKGDKVRTMIFVILAIWLVVIGGCSGMLEKDKTTTTTTFVDGSVTVEEVESSPDALSADIAKMIKACYESFNSNDGIDDKYLAKMESDDIRDVLVFKEFRAGIRDANGYDPRQICSTPTNIYDYAIAHDKELYRTISSGISDVAGLGPWGAVYGIAKSGNDNAGSKTSLGDGARFNSGSGSVDGDSTASRTTTTTINERSQVTTAETVENPSNDAPSSDNDKLF